MKKPARPRRRNPIARALRAPSFRQRVIKKKRAYSRKTKHRAPDTETDGGERLEDRDRADGRANVPWTRPPPP